MSLGSGQGEELDAFPTRSVAFKTNETSQVNTLHVWTPYPLQEAEMDTAGADPSQTEQSTILMTWPFSGHVASFNQVTLRFYTSHGYSVSLVASAHLFRFISIKFIILFLKKSFNFLNTKFLVQCSHSTKTLITTTAVTALLENSPACASISTLKQKSPCVLPAEQETLGVCGPPHSQLLLWLCRRGGCGTVGDWRDRKGRAYSRLSLVCLPRKCSDMLCRKLGSPQNTNVGQSKQI